MLASMPPLRLSGFALNVAMRLAIVVFAVVILANPEDPAFVDKGLGIRSVVILFGLSLVIPAWHLWRRRGLAYPVWYDVIFLTTFLLDLVGNVFDLYDTYFFFDWIPHSHNTGVVTIILAWILRLSLLCAVGVATILHVLFEIQEFYGDIVFGTRNVRGLFDTINDLMVGLIGSIVYGLLYMRLVRRARREPLPTDDRRT